jgi:outer membrane lipoprotein-sorting protein
MTLPRWFAFTLWALLLAQDKKAEETFTAIERQIREAKAIQVKFKVTGRLKRGEEDQTFDLSGSLMMKEGNRLRASLRSRVGNEVETLEFVSDGKRYRAGKIDAAETPKHLKSNLSVALSRLGILLGYVAAAEEQTTGADVESDWKEHYPVRDWKTGEPEPGAHSLRYTLTYEKDPVEVRLSYDPESRHPLKRTLKAKSASIEMDVEETYQELDLNPSLADDLFKVPEK